jgi:hypothetical protein
VFSQAIFRETKRPSKEMQQTIAQQLSLSVGTVSNFFMNARRRSVDKWVSDHRPSNQSSMGNIGGGGGGGANSALQTASRRVLRKARVQVKRAAMPTAMRTANGLVSVTERSPAHLSSIEHAVDAVVHACIGIKSDDDHMMADEMATSIEVETTVADDDLTPGGAGTSLSCLDELTPLQPILHSPTRTDSMSPTRCSRGAGGGDHCGGVGDDCEHESSFAQLCSATTLHLHVDKL